MNDPADIKRRYRRFADIECQGYAGVYYDLAVAVSEDEAIVDFIARMPVIQAEPLLCRGAAGEGAQGDAEDRLGAENAPEAAHRPCASAWNGADLTWCCVDAAILPR